MVLGEFHIENKAFGPALKIGPLPQVRPAAARIAVIEISWAIVVIFGMPGACD
jgi:hypothetical protein